MDVVEFTTLEESSESTPTQTEINLASVLRIGWEKQDRY